MYKEMYGNIEESLYHKLISTNVFVKARYNDNLPQLLRFAVSAAQNGEFE